MTRGYLKEPPFEIYFNLFTEEYHVIEYLGMVECESYMTGGKVKVRKSQRLGTALSYAEARKILTRYKKRKGNKRYE